MKLLVDSHALLWALVEPRRLGARAARALRSADNEASVSVVSFWEISLKFGLGKLELDGLDPERLPAAAEEAGFALIDLSSEEAASFHRLPRMAHKDPFDRMIAWQAIARGYTLISKDRGLESYRAQGLQMLW